MGMRGQGRNMRQCCLAFSYALGQFVSHTQMSYHPSRAALPVSVPMPPTSGETIFVDPKYETKKMRISIQQGDLAMNEPQWTRGLRKCSSQHTRLLEAISRKQ